MQPRTPCKAALSSSSSSSSSSALVAALLLLVSATEAAPSVTPPCTLSGTWVNELGSRMVISPANEAGVFSGSYLTAVRTSNGLRASKEAASPAEDRQASDGAITESPLQGAQHQPTQTAQPTFGFTVHWKFSASTTAFVGQCFVDERGEETLETMWLLRKEAASPAEDWQATLVGKNVFSRIK